MLQAGCIPSYWKSLVRRDLSLPDCISTHQLKQIYDVIQFRDAGSSKLMSINDPPCDTMTIQMSDVLNDYDLSSRYLKLKFQYSEEMYQEITNKQDFGFESFGSYVGGFIGIFLGYSLLQVPELIIEIVAQLGYFYQLGRTAL